MHACVCSTVMNVVVQKILMIVVLDQALHEDGAGIPNADIVIYVRTQPCIRGTLASAGACQLEKQLDR